MGAMLLGAGLVATARPSSAEPEPSSPTPEPDAKPTLEPDAKPTTPGLTRIPFEGDMPKSQQLKEAKRQRGNSVGYLPHQGDREIARRLRQEAKRLAKQSGETK